jgi:IclR family KDG regulon transcriptional repressor
LDKQKPVKEADKIASVEKAMNMLMLFEDPYVFELSIQQMSKSLAIPKSSAHRLASTLVKVQFLGHNEETKNYYLGIKNYILGSKYKSVMTLEKVAKPFLEEMVRKSGESVSLSRLEGTETVIVDKLDGVYSMRVVSQIGKHNPLHCTGSGKVFLAYATEEEKQRLLDKIQPLTAITDKTITDISLFIRNLADVRTRGYAFDDEEVFIGQTCISAPIFDSENNVLAAMTVSGPKERIHSKGIDNIGRELAIITNAIAEQMGYRKST